MKGGPGKRLNSTANPRCNEIPSFELSLFSKLSSAPTERQGFPLIERCATRQKLTHGQGEAQKIAPPRDKSHLAASLLIPPAILSTAGFGRKHGSI